jgi:hypothetical protein
MIQFCFIFLLFYSAQYAYAGPACYLTGGSCFDFSSWSDLYDLLDEYNFTNAEQFLFAPTLSSSLVLTSDVWQALRKHVDISSIHRLLIVRLHGF